MTKQQAVDLIAREFATAAHARATGNAGMVRVCARRAAGIAISCWLQEHEQHQWGSDAISQLRHLAAEESLSMDARNAATRLVAKISPDFTYPADPIEDSKLIITQMLR
jgi:hypothetical protein